MVKSHKNVSGFHHHHSTPPSPASAIDACQPIREFPIHASNVKYLNGKGHSSLLRCIGTSALTWGGRCLIMPFLCFNSQIHHGTDIEPELRLLCSPYPCFLGLITVMELADNLWKCCDSVLPHNSHPSKSIVWGTKMSSKNCVVTGTYQQEVLWTLSFLI